MPYIEVRIWEGKGAKGIPTVFKGRNFQPIIQALRYVDDLKTDNIKREFTRMFEVPKKGSVI